MKHLLIAAGIMALACVTPASGADDVDVIHKLLDTIEQAWANHDLKALSACTAEQMLVIVSRPGNEKGAFVAGKAQSLEQIAKAWANVTTHQFIEREIDVLDGVAWLRLTVIDRLADHTTRTTRVLNIAVQDGGTWKMCFSMPQIIQTATVVQDVPAGSIADLAGVRPGDMLVSVNGVSPSPATSHPVSEPGGKVSLIVQRGEQQLSLWAEGWPGGATLVLRLVPVEPAILIDADKPHGAKACVQEEFAGLITGDLERMRKLNCPAGMLAILPADAQHTAPRLLDTPAVTAQEQERMLEWRQKYDLAATSLTDVRAIAVDDVALVTGRFQSVRRYEARTAVSIPLDAEVCVRQGTQWYVAATLPICLEAGQAMAARGVSVQDARDIEARISGKMIGIGVQIEADEDGAKVKGVIAGSPAEGGGLKVGELITAVDGREIAGMALKDAVACITGAEGTSVMLTVQGADGTGRKVELVRRSFRMAPVEGQLLPQGIGLVSITVFSQGTASEFRQQVKALAASGAIGIVLDLRRCTGGTPQATKEVCESLLSKGKLLWLLRTQQGATERIISRGPADITLPMVVLIGRTTGGAGELAASALKENARAVLIGQQTSGLARMRSMAERPGGEKELVDEGTFLAKPGTPITDRGVAPDVAMPADAGDDAVLGQAADALKKTSSK